MKIQIEADVFDDPEFCDGKHDRTYKDGTIGIENIECPHLIINHRTDYSEPLYICGAFLSHGDKTDLKHEETVKHVFKCDQCKEAFKKALETPQECHFDCEKYGLPKDSAPDHCKECIHTPPF